MQLQSFTVRLLPLLLMALFTSCLKYQEVKVLGVEDVKIKEFSTKGVEVEVSIKISNPNSYKIKMVHSDLEIFVKGKKAGKARIVNKITLPKKSEAVHTFTITANYNQILSALGGGLLSLFSSGTIPLQIKGNITAKALGIRKTFPVNVKENVKL